LLLPCRSEASCSEAQISIDTVWEALARHGGSPVHQTDMDSPKEMLRMENGKLVRQCEVLFSQVAELQDQLKNAQTTAAAAEARCKHQVSMAASERKQYALVQAECAEFRRQLAASSPTRSHEALTMSGSIKAKTAWNESDRILVEQVQELRAQLLLRPSLEEHDALSSEVDRLRKELTTQGEARSEAQSLRADLSAKDDQIRALKSQLALRPSTEEHLSLRQEVEALNEKLQAYQLSVGRTSQPSSPLLSSRVPECPQAVPVFYASRSVPRQRPMVANLITPRSSAPSQGTAVLPSQTSSCSQPVSFMHTTSRRPQLDLTPAPRDPSRSSAGMVALETPRGGQRAWSGQMVPSLDLNGGLSARAQSPLPGSLSMRSQAGRVSHAGYVGAPTANGCPTTPRTSETVYFGHALRPIQVARAPSTAWESLP